jgi:hypothetical protein
MGLATSVMRLMVRMHQEHPWTGPVVTLGVQDVPATYDQLAGLFKQERARSAPLPPAERLLSTSHLFQRSGAGGNGFVHPRVLFRMLGIDQYDDMDYADFEKPTLIHDLNRPIPEDWHGRYGMVVDGGTTEHVFDVRATLANTVALLRLGGDVLHVSPLSGWLNHGFYQLNPCLFFDYYRANGFDMRGAYVVLLPRDPTKSQEVVRPFTYTEQMFELDGDSYRALFVFRACKVAQVPACIPTQGYYQKLVASTKAAG